MRVFILNVQSKNLLRGVALGLIAGLGAGCSSDFSRFAPQASDYTGSINQAQIIRKVSPSMPVAAQPFPDELPAPALAGNQPLYTGSVQGNTIRPAIAQAESNIQRKTLAPIGKYNSKIDAMQPMPAPISAARRAVTPDVLSVQDEVPVTLAKKAIVKPIKKLGAPVLDDTVTGAVEATPQRVVKAVKQPLPVAEDMAAAEPTLIKKPKLDTKPRVLGPVDDTADAAPLPAKTVASVKPGTGGKYITVAAGDTIYSIANRVHKPSTKILAANHLPSGTALKVGQKLLIPDATTAALDTSTTGSISTDTPLEKTPSPGKTPKHETVAVLPTVPQVKGKATAKDAVATAAPAKPTTVKSKVSAGSYAVASGDSMYSIAKKNGISVAELKAANTVEDGKLKIGQTLKIPAKGAAVVASAKPVANLGIDPIVTGSAATSTKKKLGPVVDDTPAPAPAKVPVAAPATPSNEAIAEAEKDTAAAPDATGISKLRWPVRGRTLTSFGQSGDGGHANDGVDISVPNGTPVKAAENGVVIYAGTGLKDFGNTVLVRHENGLVTVYGNNGEISVKRGEKVKRGQELAKSGMSGNTKVPKLHFEVRKNSTPVNPTGYLE